MRKLIGFLLSVCLLACGEPPKTVVSVQVVDAVQARALDSACVRFWRSVGDQMPQLVDSFWTEEGQASFSFMAEPGYQYSVEATRRHYLPMLADDGSGYANLLAVEPGDTLRDTLRLEPILPPDPERYERMHAEVSVPEVLTTLKADAWEWAFLPKLSWTDIPALLPLGADTNFVHQYPLHPLSRYRPDSTRVGLVALWLIEAIRRQESRKTESARLMPPSRAPFLGTRRGNPKGYNSPGQVAKAHAAYETWWEKAQADTLVSRAARPNPLRGSGMSWM
ncbi:MAG: DUF4943 family protein [Bacteroidota bacterium]